MKKTLIKTALLCTTLMVGLSAFSAGSDVTGVQPGAFTNYGALDAGTIDNGNFIRNQRYVEKQKYEATKDPAVI